MDVLMHNDFSIMLGTVHFNYRIWSESSGASEQDQFFCSQKMSIVAKNLGSVSVFYT